MGGLLALTVLYLLLCVGAPTNVLGHPVVSSSHSRGGNLTPEGLPEFVGNPEVSATLGHRLDMVALVSPAAGGPVSNPAWLAYDHATSTFYVATPPSSVDLVPFTDGSLQTPSSVLVGASPFGVAVDNTTGDVFVTNTGSDNVSVVSDVTAQVVGTVSAGSAPYGVAFDWLTGDLFVANADSNNVSVISGGSLAVLTSIPVGPGPLGVAFDPTTGDVFVADHGASEVTVISGTTLAVVASVTVGQAPYGVAVDPTTDAIYVTDEGSSNVSVISASTDRSIASIPVVYPGAASDLQGIAFDARDGLIWAGAGSFYAVVIDPTTEAVADYVNTDPSGVVFDPDSGDVCFTNTANVTFGCFLFPEDATRSTPLTFDETGLPSGTPWSVNVSAVYSSPPYPVATSNTTSLSVGVLALNYYAFQALPTDGYAASPSSGQLLVHSTPAAVVNITYYRASALYAVNFTETGLPSGSVWYVNLSGYPSLQGSGPTLSIDLPTGTYPYITGTDDPAFSAPTGDLVVNGGPVNITVGFLEEFYNVTFTESELPLGTPWSVTVPGLGTTSSTSFNASMTAPDGAYTYTSATVTGNWSGDGGAFRVSGASVLVTVTFIAVNASVTVNETGLPAGLLSTQGWTASLHGITNHSAASSVGFAIPNGTYGLLVTGPPGYASNGSGWVTVHGTTRLVVAFTRSRTLTLTFSERGLPRGQAWCVAVDGASACSSGPTLKYRDLGAASYTYAVLSPTKGQVVSGKIGPTSVGSSGTLSLTRSEAVALTFSHPYAVTFTDAGLTSGTWSITIKGHTQTAPWDQPITFNLTNGTFGYRIGTETGFKAAGSPPRVLVNGRAVSVVITFRRL